MTSVIIEDAFGGKHPQCFNQNIDTLQKYLQDYVRKIGENLRVRNNIEEYNYKLLEAGTNKVYVYGRIYAGFQEDDPTEKLTDKNAELHFVPDYVDVPYLKIDYQNGVIPGLFRGQIIAAEGTVDTNVFHASKIFTDCRIKPPPTLPDDFKTRIIAVSGPFDYETFEPIEELNAKIRSYKPELVIFLGPFALQTSKLLNSADCKFTAQELSEEVINQLGKEIDNAVFIPADTDALSLPTIPRPSLQINTDQSIMGDPSFITLNNHLKITATSNDLQFLIAQQYNGAGNTRREEIPRQIAHQCSACPVMDSAIQNQYLSALVPKDTPNIFLLSTRFFPLHNNIDGTHVIYLKQDIRTLNFTVIDVDGNNITSEVKNDFNKI